MFVVDRCLNFLKNLLVRRNHEIIMKVTECVIEKYTRDLIKIAMWFCIRIYSTNDVISIIQQLQKK